MSDNNDMTDAELTAWLIAWAASQEPLGSDFEAVWDANTDRLYED